MTQRLDCRKRFALLGAAGFVARRHMKAIQSMQSDLVLACDPVDSVGILDSYFPACRFHTCYEEFLLDIESRVTHAEEVHYCSICTPNYLHRQQMIDVLERGSHVICEKPLVLSLEHVSEIQTLASRYQRQVYPIFQLRLHPTFLAMKQYVSHRISSGPDKKMSVNLVFRAPRGHWYTKSWKFDREKSGGLLFNIGIHFFDVLLVLFGIPRQIEVFQRGSRQACGRFEFDHASVDWLLSIEVDPEKRSSAPNRAIQIDETLFDFSQGFEDLHTKYYEHILQRDQSAPVVSLEEVSKAIELIEVLYDIPLAKGDVVSCKSDLQENV